MKQIYNNLIFSIVLFAFLCNSQINFANNKDEDSKFKINFNGFVNSEVSYDTRQVVAGRHGNILLYPAPENFDPDGNDINDNPDLAYFAMTSRLWTSIHGPDILGAKSYAHVEGDFMGTVPDNFHHLRLRHAFIRLNWDNSEIVAGQYWHPLFITTCFPGVINFGASVPIHVLNRAPQLRFTYKFESLSFIGTVLTHSDFAATGHDGPNTKYTRNSGVPESFFQTMFSGDILTTGASIGYMTLMPRTETPNGYKTNETMESLMGNLFFKLDFPSLSIKTQGIYGENMTHLVMLGGYGETDYIDESREIRGYSGIRTMSLWTDVETTGNNWRFGLFGGYTQNLGSEKEITGEHWGRGTNIEYVYRIAPRISRIYDNLSLNLEIIYDVAAYGEPDNKFMFEESKEISNIRTLLTMRYDF